MANLLSLVFFMKRDEIAGQLTAENFILLC